MLDNKEFLKKAASRKFITMFVCQSMWILLYILGPLTESGFITLTQLTIGGYFLANVIGKFNGKN